MTVKQDEPLTRSAFLLAFDLRKHRLVGKGTLGYLLRATAMAELLLAGHLADESGKARAVGAPPEAAPGSLQAIVWEQIAGSPPLHWWRWVAKDHGKAVRVVRDELAADRLIQVERHRVLLFPVERIIPRKAYMSRRLAERVGRVIRGGRPIRRLDQDLRVLAALAGTAQVRGVLTGREAHRYRNRIEQLAEPIEPIAKALHKTIHAANSSASSG